jgi:cell division septation protein DedD
VRAERTAADRLQALSEVPIADVRPPSAGKALPAPGADPTRAAPPPAVDDLSYFDRLEESTPPVEALKRPIVADDDEAPPEAAPRARSSSSVPPVRPLATRPNPPAPAPAPASVSGFAVQVAALNVRKEAETVAHRLSAKGYEAYVLASTAGAPVYRVRVGPFKTRRDAESTANRLQREEQFKPWITR